jgi:hypothetical protein
MQLVQVGQPYTLAVGASFVYWTDLSDNTVKRCATSGCASATTVASGLATPIGISVLSPHAAWADHGTGATGDITTCNVFGSCMPPTVLAMAPKAWDVALDSTTAYFTQPGAGTVSSVPIAGGTVKMLASISPSTPQNIAVDANNVYFTTGGSGQVALCPHAGCGSNPTVLAMGAAQVGAQGIAVDATNVYWVNSTPPGNVSKCAITGCGGNPTVIAMSGANSSPTAVAVDATNVYWATGGSGQIMRVPIGGGGVTTLATGLSNASGMALDATFVYYADGGTGQIFKLAK